MHRRAFEAGVALLAGALAYLVLLAGKFPAYFYLPTQHRWAWDPPPGVIGMDWFYRASVALLVALAMAVAAHVLGRRVRALDGPAPARLVFGLGFAMVFWACTYTVFGLVTTPRQRHPHADPAPTHDHE